MLAHAACTRLVHTNNDAIIIVLHPNIFFFDILITIDKPEWTNKSLINCRFNTDRPSPKWMNEMYVRYLCSMFIHFLRAAYCVVYTRRPIKTKSSLVPLCAHSNAIIVIIIIIFRGRKYVLQQPIKEFLWKINDSFSARFFFFLSFVSWEISSRCFRRHEIALELTAT